MKAEITAFGTYVPDKVVTNQDIEKMVDTNNEWIIQRTGIHERRFRAENEYTIDMAEKAVKALLEKYQTSIEDVDFIIVATVSQDHVFPSVATQIQDRFNIPKAGAIDITAACAGFVYGVQLANGLIQAGSYKKILVIGAETLTRFVDFTDRTTCILFADGAGAAIIEASDKQHILSTSSGSNGDGGKFVYLSTNCKYANGVEINANNKIFQEGRRVFKWAIETVSRESLLLIEKAGLKKEDIDWFVPHSANQRIIEAICQNIDFPLEKTLASLKFYGNTSSASIPLAIQIAMDEGKIKKGDKLLIIGFGGGLTYAGAIVEWHL